MQFADLPFKGHARSTDGDLLALTVAFEQAAEASCRGRQSAKGIDIDWFNENSGRERPWLAAPSFSAEGVFLATERYLESDDPATASLGGVVVVNTLTSVEIAVAEGASQPAWRPAPPLDPAALRFVQPGARLITLEPSLIYEGKRCRISYLNGFRCARPLYMLPERLAARSSHWDQSHPVLFVLCTSRSLRFPKMMCMGD